MYTTTADRSLMNNDLHILHAIPFCTRGFPLQYSPLTYAKNSKLITEIPYIFFIVFNYLYFYNAVNKSNTYIIYCATNYMYLTVGGYNTLYITFITLQYLHYLQYNTIQSYNRWFTLLPCWCTKQKKICSHSPHKNGG